MHPLPSDIQHIRSQQPGPRVAIMAVCHGNEVAGVAAIKALEEHFTEHPLLCGELYLIYGNPRAYQQETLCIDDNLNRIFLPETELPTDVNKEGYEFQRSRELMELFQNIDILFDIHSTNRDAAPFSISFGNTSLHIELQDQLPIAFRATGLEQFVHGTAIEYVDQQGGTGVLIECGGTHSPTGPLVAVEAAKRVLNHLEMTCFDVPPHKPQRKVLHVFHQEQVRDHLSFEYTQNYMNFDPIAPGELIASDHTHQYTAPDQSDQVIVFPTNIDYVRSGAIKEAYLLGQFQ